MAKNSNRSALKLYDVYRKKIKSELVPFQSNGSKDFFTDSELGGAGCSTYIDVIALAEYVRRFDPYNILEIGSYIGWSTIHLAHYSRNEITAIDPFIECNGQLGITSEDKINRFKENIAAAGMTDKVKLIVGASPYAVESLDTTFDFVFIDGWHLNGQPLIDVQAVYHKIVGQSIIALHDHYFPDVQIAAEFLKSKGFSEHVMHTPGELAFYWRSFYIEMDKFIRWLDNLELMYIEGKLK